MNKHIKYELKMWFRLVYLFPFICFKWLKQWKYYIVKKNMSFGKPGSILQVCKSFTVIHVKISNGEFRIEFDL